MMSKTSFDPKIGFTIREVTVKDSGDIACKIKMGDYEEENSYWLSVNRKYYPIPLNAVSRFYFGRMYESVALRT